MAEEGAAPDEQEAYGSKPIAPSLAWTDITKQEVKKFMKIDKPQDALQFVATKFALTDYETNAKNAILVDFYLSILVFCKERGFSEEKASAAFTIVRMTREFAVKDGKPVQETFAEFKGLVLKHSLSGVPNALVLFKPQDVAELTKFVTSTFMQHYRLYQYAHNHEQVRMARAHFCVHVRMHGEGAWCYLDAYSYNRSNALLPSPLQPLRFMLVRPRTRSSARPTTNPLTPASWDRRTRTNT
jgi:hypothetical protein